MESCGGGGEEGKVRGREDNPLAPMEERAFASKREKDVAARARREGSQAAQRGEDEIAGGRFEGRKENISVFRTADQKRGGVPHLGGRRLCRMRMRGFTQESFVFKQGRGEDSTLSRGGRNSIS